MKSGFSHELGVIQQPAINSKEAPPLCKNGGSLSELAPSLHPQVIRLLNFVDVVSEPSSSSSFCK
ncbi:hypothetical protein BVC80_9101g284 [Macleaya cordata]|uniref:Uncharacterized protein n=1 Tax=Macleaya cordata TaxID=56857 RepID=A0A200QGX0_MACCD|nr:hypothetical protein BVC80_9101g284 [Macleaya cordata]